MPTPRAATDQLDNPNPPVPQWLTDVVGPVSPEIWAAACANVDKLGPLTEGQRDRLRLIFRAPRKGATS